MTTHHYGNPQFIAALAEVGDAQEWARDQDWWTPDGDHELTVIAHKTRTDTYKALGLAQWCRWTHETPGWAVAAVVEGDGQVRDLTAGEREIIETPEFVALVARITTHQEWEAAAVEGGTDPQVIAARTAEDGTRRYRAVHAQDWPHYRGTGLALAARLTADSELTLIPTP